MKNEVKYSGIKDLATDEQTALKSIVEKEYKKLQRMIKNDSVLNVHVKVLKKETRKRFLISMRLETPMKLFTTKNKETEKGGDWDLNKAVHQEMDSLYFEVKHHLRADQESWKRGGLRSFFNRLKS